MYRGKKIVEAKFHIQNFDIRNIYFDQTIYHKGTVKYFKIKLKNMCTRPIFQPV